MILNGGNGGHGYLFGNLEMFFQGPLDPFGHFRPTVHVVPKDKVKVAKEDSDIPSEISDGCHLLLIDEYNNGKALNFSDDSRLKELEKSKKLHIIAFTSQSESLVGPESNSMNFRHVFGSVSTQHYKRKYISLPLDSTLRMSAEILDLAERFRHHVASAKIDYFLDVLPSEHEMPLQAGHNAVGQAPIVQIVYKLSANMLPYVALLYPKLPYFALCCLNPNSHRSTSSSTSSSEVITFLPEGKVLRF